MDPVEDISSVNEIQVKIEFQVKIHTQVKIQDQDTFQEERRTSWDLLVVVNVGFVRNSIPHTHIIQVSIVVCCQGACEIQAGQVSVRTIQNSRVYIYTAQIYLFLVVLNISLFHCCTTYQKFVQQELGF